MVSCLNVTLVFTSVLEKCNSMIENSLQCCVFCLKFSYSGFCLWLGFLFVCFLICFVGFFAFLFCFLVGWAFWFGLGFFNVDHLIVNFTISS